jgi:hypothetical protein
MKVMSSSVEHFRLLRLDGPKTDQPYKGVIYFWSLSHKPSLRGLFKLAQ